MKQNKMLTIISIILAMKKLPDFKLKWFFESL